MSRARTQTILAIVGLLLVGAGLRVGWVLRAYGSDGAWARLAYPDEEAYVRAAAGLASGQGLVDEFGYRATYMPAYPAFLAVFQGREDGLLWARLAQGMLAAIVAPATYLLARNALAHLETGGRTSVRSWMPLAAGGLAAIDPFLVFFSGLLLTEALFAAAFILGWACLAPPAGDTRAAIRRGGCAGLLLLASIMLRPSAAMVLVLAAPVLLAITRARRVTLRQLAIAAVVILVGLTPWAIRNRLVLGEWVWLTTRGGISLYDGVRPGATGGSDLADTKTWPEVQGLPETQWDAYFARRAREAIASEPARIVRLAAAKFLRTWSVVPNVAEHRAGRSAMISAAWMVLVLGTAAFGAWRIRRDWRTWGFLIWPVVGFTLVHMIFVGSVRYRVPTMPCLYVLAAIGPAAIRRRAGEPSGEGGAGPRVAESSSQASIGSEHSTL